MILVEPLFTNMPDDRHVQELGKEEFQGYKIDVLRHTGKILWIQLRNFAKYTQHHNSQKSLSNIYSSPPSPSAISREQGIKYFLPSILL